MNLFSKRSVVFLFSILILSCTKETKPVFTISGNISPEHPEYIILKQETDIERKISEIVDTLYIDGQGNFKADYNLEPHLYTLHLNNKKKIMLAIDKGQDVTINIDENETKITGSKDTDVLLAYEALRKKSLDSLVQSVRKQVKAIRNSENPDEEKIRILEELEVENYEKHLVELNDFIKNNMGGTIGLYATSIRWRGAKNIPFFDSLTTAFENTHQNLAIAEKLREKITRLQQTSVGGIAPEINMNTAEGEPVALSSINKKYTLVDFWASWCGPCRSESKSLNIIYEKYNKKGFEIFGVSLDSNREKWLKAIEKDHRVWPNVSSLKSFKTKAAYDYAVTALPDNYLIDIDRKIIAKNIHGKELETLLNELLGKD